MGIRGDETYGKRKENAIETSVKALEQGGNDRVNQESNLPAVKTKKRALHRRASRCPYTLDFIDGCADCDKPAPRAAGA